MNASTQDPIMTASHAPAEVVPTTNDSNRCQHRFANGKRCRLPGSKPHFGLCSHHFNQSNPATSSQSFNDFEDLSADLLPELSEFASGIDIRQFLARLLTLVTKGRISPRRASVLAFITSQLLHSHRAITRESAPAKEETQIIIDIPRPNRDWPDTKPRPENPTYADLRS